MAQRKSNWLCLFVAAGLAFSFAGCGGDSDEGSDGEGTSSTSDKSGSERSASTGGSSTKGSDERPNVDGIPINVFFPEPLAVAAESGEIVASTNTTGGGETGSAATPETGTEQPAEPETAAANGEVAWNDVISTALLEDEMKSIRLQLQQRLTTLASYNSSYLEIPIFATTLSLMAEIGRRHPDDISWKKNAKHIRVLSVQMSDVCASAGARGRKSYDEVNGAFLKISDILNNSVPAELPEADDDSDFLSAADMGYLMKRLKRGMGWMQNNTGTEDAFKENLALVKREVGVITAIGQVFADESYGYSDDTEFTGHTFEMRDAAKGMSKAAAGNDFGTYDELRSKVDQKCTQCHMTFRTG